AFGASLSAAQLRAATYGEPGERGVAAGPPLVIAGAGTGKTSTPAHRVASLLLSGVCSARPLLRPCPTRAAHGMLRRREHIVRDASRTASRAADVPEATRGLWAGTYHSIGNRLLREYAEALGLDPSFSVLDRGDAADLLDL